MCVLRADMLTPRDDRENLAWLRARPWSVLSKEITIIMRGCRDCGKCTWVRGWGLWAAAPSG